MGKGRLSSDLPVVCCGRRALSQPAGGLAEIPSSLLLAPGDSSGLIPSANTFKELAEDMKWVGRLAFSKHREIVERDWVKIIFLITNKHN